LSPAREDDALALFEVWYECEMPRLFSYIYYQVGDRGLAEELTAAVCERALVRLHQYDSARGEMKAWMFGIARNEIRRHIRSQRGRPALLSLEDMPVVRIHGRPVETHYQAKEVFREILGCLHILSRNDQEIIALRYGAGLSNQEIAEVTGLTVMNVRVRLSRALRKLRKELEQKLEVADV
jgi:RNA polymerase sigma factor (sigma-70 family)